MQTVTIKSGTTAKIKITPKINGQTATSGQMSGVTIYVFFVYQFTNKIYKEYSLTSSNTTITLTAAETKKMLGNAEENQRFEIQFAIKDASGNVIAEEQDSNLCINITRWEAGLWLQKDLT